MLVNSRSSSGANLYVRIFRQHLGGNKFNRSNSVTENPNHCLVLIHVAKNTKTLQLVEVRLRLRYQILHRVNCKQSILLEGKRPQYHSVLMFDIHRTIANGQDGIYRI